MSATPDYAMGFSEAVRELLMRNTAEACAAYLLPHLRPGQRVLDFGCGPGTISAGLAHAVAPGELHGVDMEPSQVDLARGVAASLGRDNAVFHVGDVVNLPFADGFFDVAHCHNVLMHVPDTGAALSEVKRVLKPDGIIGCREMIIESNFVFPDSGIIRRSMEIYGDVVTTDGGHPQMGKHLKRDLAAAGFTDVRYTATFAVWSTAQDIAAVHAFANQWLLSEEMTERALGYGASTEQLFHMIEAEFDHWKSYPDALFALAFGEAVARNS